MEDVNFRRSFPFINNTLFSNYDVPIPMNDKEKIIYYNHTTKFSLVLGDGSPAYTSHYKSIMGSIYLTNRRIIYRPEKPTDYFNSFFIIYEDVIKIEPDSYFQIKVKDGICSNVYINLEDSNSMVFFNALNKIHSERICGNNGCPYGIDEELPLYCEAINDKSKEFPEK